MGTAVLTEALKRNTNDSSDTQGTLAATWPPGEVFLAGAKDQPALGTTALWA